MGEHRCGELHVSCKAEPLVKATVTIGLQKFRVYLTGDCIRVGSLVNRVNGDANEINDVFR